MLPFYGFHRYINDEYKKIIDNSYVILSVWKVTIIDMKLSRIRTERITFHSVVNSPNKRQMDSRANLTAGGGFVIDLTSTKFCFLIDWTARKWNTKSNELQIKS